MKAARGRRLRAEAVCDTPGSNAEMAFACMYGAFTLSDSPPITAPGYSIYPDLLGPG
jgi:hypothetical protein